MGKLIIDGIVYGGQGVNIETEEEFLSHPHDPTEVTFVDDDMIDALDIRVKDGVFQYYDSDSKTWASVESGISEVVNTLDSKEEGKPLSASMGNLLYEKILENKQTKLSSRRTRKSIESSEDLANLITAIAEQDLEKYGLSIGDYFTGPSGYKYFIADMDTYYGGYDSYGVVSKHHVGVVVDTFSTCQWLSSGNATSYNKSTLHTFLKGNVLTNIKSDLNSLFGAQADNHIVSYTMLDNAVGAWGDTWVTGCEICALTEVQIYGSRVFGCDGFQTGLGKKQLEIFRKFSYNEIFGNKSLWLKSLMSASGACDANNSGYASRSSLGNSYGACGLILFY